MTGNNIEIVDVEEYKDLVDLQQLTQKEVKRVQDELTRIASKLETTIATLKSNKNEGNTDTLVSLALVKHLEKILVDIYKAKQVV